MKTAFFDCFSGASGDMILGALLDAGVDFEQLMQELAKLELEGYRLEAAPVTRQGIGATQFRVHLQPGLSQPHRHLKDIQTLVGKAPLPETVQKNALRTFQKLGEAEARVHRTSIEKVHFHEVGAVDSIIDIVGAAIGLHLLGIDQIASSLLITGRGFVTCQHGRLPVPAPATAELLRGIPSREGGIERELLTPTGAAILTTLSSSFGPRPDLQMEAIGYGAGAAELAEQPNLLRVFIGQASSEPSSDLVWVVETNLDDISAEAVGYVSEKLFKTGALDVYSIPVQMKKSRPGVLLGLIVCREKLKDVEQVLLEETTTFGLRRCLVERTVLDREIAAVKTEYGQVRVKLGRMNGRLLKASPEYEDCRRLAEEKGIPFHRIHEAAAREATRRFTK